MIVSVTTLGSRSGDALGAAARVVAYLDGRSPARGGAHPQTLPELPGPGPTPATGTNRDIVGYYADSVDGPGHWLGRGVGPVRPAGQVDPEALRRVLLGQDPATGAQLIRATGSAARAELLGRSAASEAPTRSRSEGMTIADAAAALEVSPRYLRRLATETAALRRRQAAQFAAGTDVEPTPRSYLDATQGACRAHWTVNRDEVARFRTERRSPTAVVGYDLTFSVPKSVSVLWATADPFRQEEILASVHAAVAAGVEYLQEHAAFVQRSSARGHGGPRRERSTGLLAASYLHATSRALDPQLHCHVVVANMAERPDGALRALDGRPLYAHAKTAQYLAGAELRHQLSRRLGVTWAPPERGVADIVGVSTDAMAEMSQRSRSMGELLRTLGDGVSAGEEGRPATSTPKAKQMAAYATRAPKDHAVDPAALRPSWANRLEAVGFDHTVADACYDRQATIALVTEDERAALFERLASPTGVTESAAAFDRRDVIQHVAQWAGDRMTTSEICDLADGWLASEEVVRLDVGRRDGRAGDVIRLRHGQAVSAVDDEALYSTRSMLTVEASIWAAYDAGRHRGLGIVAEENVDAVLVARPELGADQAAMVRTITTSGHGIQCVLGRAGAGKTRALEAAAQAWADAGYTVLGAAVGGTQAEVLQAATGIPSTTVASLLARLDYGSLELDERTVVAVDEASTLANRDLARLARYCRVAGAALRLAGDPAQHTAVAAGGAWRSLLERHPDDAALLTESRRLQGPEMAQVRLAFEEYRAGHIAEALDRLGRDHRVVEAPSADELFDALVADWYVDRQRRRAQPSLPPSSMIAEHHGERAELNRRARALLAADGELAGPELRVAGVTFQAGDEVISRVKDPSLRPEGGGRRSAVTNGLRGRVIEVRPPTAERPDSSLVVDFERRGPVVVPYAALTRKLRAGVVGVLGHSYALTSHAAQGETYEAGRHLATERSSRAGVYVGLSRGRSDVRLYMVRKHDLSSAVEEHPELPRLTDASTLLDAVTARLDAERSERLAIEVDPDAPAVAALRARFSVPQLAAQATGRPDGRLAARALDQELAAVATAARLRPDPALTARLGARPQPGPDRDTWDDGIGLVARYRARWGPLSVDRAAGGAGWALGPRPTSPNPTNPSPTPAPDYDRAAAALRAAEVAFLARRPVPELSGEWRELCDALAVSSTTSRRDGAALSAGVARQRVQEQSAHTACAQARVDSLEAAPRRRRNSQGIELARREADDARRRLAKAQAVLADATDRLQATEMGVEAQRPARNRRDLLDAALEVKTAAAVASPAPYLLDSLGPRPEASEPAAAWDASATRIESYRHRQLGLDPDDGPAAAGDATVAAIGPAPEEYALHVQWRAVAATLDQGAELKPPAYELGIDL